MLLGNTYFNLVLLVNTEKIVLLTNEVFLIKCCCRIKKTKLTRECCDSALLRDLDNEVIHSSWITLPLVAIFTPGDGILGDSSNYKEIADVPQVQTLTKESYLTWFSGSVLTSQWDSWEWDITVVELEAGKGRCLTDHPNLSPKFLNETADNHLLIFVSSSIPTQLVNGWFQRNK